MHASVPRRQGSLRLRSEGALSRDPRQTGADHVRSVVFDRAYYLCPGCHQGQSPRDQELEGRLGRREGQPARTREVKLSCVFTQPNTDLEGRPIRDAASTTYTGAIETAELFGRRLYAEAWERGWDRAKKKAVLGDGAE